MPLVFAAVLAGSAQANDRLKPVMLHKLGEGGIVADVAKTADGMIAVIGTSMGREGPRATMLIDSKFGGDWDASIQLPIPEGAVASAAVSFLGGPNHVVGSVTSNTRITQSGVWSREGDLPTWIWYPIAAGKTSSYVHGATLIKSGTQPVLVGTELDERGRKHGFFSTLDSTGRWYKKRVLAGEQSQILGVTNQLIFDDTDGSERVWLHGSMKRRVRQGRRIVTAWVPTVWSLECRPGAEPVAIAIPNLLDARKSGNESSAIGTLRTSNPLYGGADPVRENPLFGAAGGPGDLDGDGDLDAVMIAGGSSGTASGDSHPDFLWLPTGPSLLHRLTCNAKDDDCNGVEDSAAVMSMIAPVPGVGAFRAGGIKWFNPTKLSAPQVTPVVWGKFGGEPIDLRLLMNKQDIIPVFLNKINRQGIIFGQATDSEGKTKGGLFIPDTTFVPDSRETLVGIPMPDDGLGVLAQGDDGLAMKVRPLNDKILIKRVVVETSSSTAVLPSSPRDGARPKEKANKTKCRVNLRVNSPTGNADQVTIAIELYDHRSGKWVVKRIDKATPDLNVISAEGDSTEGQFLSRTGEVRMRIIASAPSRIGSWQLEVDKICTEMVSL